MPIRCVGTHKDCLNLRLFPVESLFPCGIHRFLWWCSFFEWKSAQLIATIHKQKRLNLILVHSGIKKTSGIQNLDCRRDFWSVHFLSKIPWQKKIIWRMDVVLYPMSSCFLLPDSKNSKITNISPWCSIWY